VHSAGGDLWYDQKLDHFDPSNAGTYKQRYLVNATTWGGAGYPVFVVLGGEGPLSPRELTGRFIINEYAARFKALMVSVEHRFYGLSVPAGGLTLANLKLLTSRQAVTDYAQFIDFILGSYNTTASRVVTFGGSYSGSLSAWMRQKFPSLVHAAVASSAPVLAQVDFPEYLQVVQASLGPSCSARVGLAFRKIESLLQTPDGRTWLAAAYNACEPISAQRFDQATFLESLADTLCGFVQYNLDNNGMLPTDITGICKIIEAGDDPEVAFRQFVAYNSEQFGQTCYDSTYASQIKELSDTDPNSDNAASRAWVWQTCVEFGYYQTVETKDSPFSNLIDLPYFLAMCKDVYGVEANAVSAAVDATNDFYGALKLGTTRVVLPNGSVDPWHVLGILQAQPLDQDIYPILISGTAHCSDLYATGANDLPGLTQARTRIVQLLTTWLS
jgi:pimeloyl-ACP methyl ester carboxylesterase